MTQTELAEKYLIDKGQLSRTAVELEQKGLLARKSRDWRTTELNLTTEGRKTFAAIERISRGRHLALIAGVSERDLRVLYKSLGKISINAGALLNQAKGGTSSE